MQAGKQVLGTTPAGAGIAVGVGHLTAASVPAKIMLIQIGRKRFQVESFQQASEMYCAARDAHGEGASKTPSASIVDEHGGAIGYVSYNGRVWADDPRSPDWKPGATPLYENRAM